MRTIQVLIAIDQFANTLLGGWADETLSARAWRCRNKDWAWRIMHRVIDTLFFFQPQHCYSAYVSEQQRTQAPPEER